MTKNNEASSGTKGQLIGARRSKQSGKIGAPKVEIFPSLLRLVPTNRPALYYEINEERTS